MSDYGLNCPRCNEQGVWDRLYGNCWRCGYRTNPALLAWMWSLIKRVFV